MERERDEEKNKLLRVQQQQIQRCPFEFRAIQIHTSYTQVMVIFDARALILCSTACREQEVLVYGATLYMSSSINLKQYRPEELVL